MISNKKQSSTPIFNNEIINKGQLKKLMSEAFHNYGTVKSSIIADKVKNLTFHYATKSGISLSIEDLRVPETKRSLIGLTNNDVETTEQNYGIGNITNVERFQKVIDTWNNASNFLKEEVVTYFRESDPLNSLYIMAFSGARGNISQVRQLVGMRGLMADQQGQIIDLPIQSNFREGLTVTEYIISSYGARKGLVDTALRTADSGYLTRRLVDVAQDIIVREEDCQTNDGLLTSELIADSSLNLSIKDRIVGRLLAEPIILSETGQKLVKNTSITNDLLDTISIDDLNQIRIRSPLTCNSIRSICRNCYGWHLAYSKIVDLGEAIGIIAAQSIGEPGTQLTMRTFHTGGVFSGDLTRQIRAPFPGILKYTIDKNAKLGRTLHGERSFQSSEKITIYVENLKGSRTKINLPKGATILLNSGEKVYTNQIIAEVKKDANLVLEEDSKTVYTNISGEVFFQDIEIEEILDKQGSLIQKNKNTGLIWILCGERYSLPRLSTVIGKIGQLAKSGSIIAQKQILNIYPGYVKFQKLTKRNEINILNFSLILKNANVTSANDTTQEKQILKLNNGQKFDLEVRHNDRLYDGQTIALLEDNSYKTETGGTVAYNLDKKFATKKRKSTSNLFSGSLYWIPEETHYVKTPNLLEKLKIKNGIFVPKGTEILPKQFTKVSGILQTNFVTQEIIIKPGELVKLSEANLKLLPRINGFLKPGEKIINNVVVQKLSFVEFIEINNLQYLLIRPVHIYRVPRKKGFFLNHAFCPTVDKSRIKIKTVKKIFLKNWEHVKSKKEIELLQTFLVLDLDIKQVKFQPRFELLQRNINDSKLQISLYENLKIDDLLPNYETQNIETNLTFLAHHNQYVNSLSALAQVEIILPTQGTLTVINNTKNNSTEILILQDKDIKLIRHYSKITDLQVKIGDLIRTGSNIALNLKSEYSGQVYDITETHIHIRLGRPYLISEGAIMEVQTGSLVQRMDKLATLIYEKLKTVDIVQGLPKVEEILEARKIKNPCILAPHSGYANIKNSRIEILTEKEKITTIEIDSRTKVRFLNGNYIKFAEPLTDGPISPHNKLETLFNYYYYIEKLLVNDACRASFRDLQLFLVNDVQRTYSSQNVQIADKHVEIIIKQMTSKVQIEDSGDTTLLPGELLNLYQAEIITKAALTANEQIPFYRPVLLGITKAALNSDSFISAASFQETTRVLTEAAIEGKKDWLHGLKENVIIGRLIPAGTGFKYYKNVDFVNNKTKPLNRIIQSQIGDIKNTVLRSHFQQIIET